MKKIIIVLEDGTEQFLGYSDCLKDWFLIAEKRLVVPFRGEDGYTIVHNVYNKQYKQHVTYKSV